MDDPFVADLERSVLVDAIRIKLCKVNGARDIEDDVGGVR
jgi:hypothetical protein